jgi:hypothetical protein
MKKPAFDFKKFERQYLMGLSKKSAGLVMALVLIDSKFLASHYCMGILSAKQKEAFTEGCLMSFPNFLNVDQARMPFEKFFDTMVGPGKIFYIHSTERRIEWKSDRQRTKFGEFYTKHMFRKTLDWIAEFRRHGVFNWAHYDTYQMIARYGFPIMSNVMQSLDE